MLISVPFGTHLVDLGVDFLKRHAANGSSVEPAEIIKLEALKLPTDFCRHVLETRDPPFPLICGSTSSAIFAMGKEGIRLAPARRTAG